jgi:hypothetical protein
MSAKSAMKFRIGELTARPNRASFFQRVRWFCPSFAAGMRVPLNFLEVAPGPIPAVTLGLIVAR